MTVKTDLQTVLDMATGADDGGASYLHLRFLLEDMEKQAATGDQAAAQLVGFLTNFARLIRFASKTGGTPVAGK